MFSRNFAHKKTKCDINMNKREKRKQKTPLSNCQTLTIVNNLQHIPYLMGISVQCANKTKIHT